MLNHFFPLLLFDQTQHIGLSYSHVCHSCFLCLLIILTLTCWNVKQFLNDLRANWWWRKCPFRTVISGFFLQCAQQVLLFFIRNYILIETMIEKERHLNSSSDLNKRGLHDDSTKFITRLYYLSIIWCLCFFPIWRPNIHHHRKLFVSFCFF